MDEMQANSEYPKVVACFHAHVNGTTSASFSPDGQILATSGYDSIIRLWDTQTWQPIRTIPGQRRGHLAYSPNGKRLVSGGLGTHAEIFDTSDWKKKKVIKDRTTIWSLCYRPNGDAILFAQPPDDDIDLPSKNLVESSTQSWSQREILAFGRKHIVAMACSRDGQWVAVAHDPDGTVEIWDANFNRILHSLAGNGLPTWGISFSPDGRFLATGGADNAATIWNTHTCEVKYVLQHREFDQPRKYRNAVLCTAYAPTAALLVTGGLDGNITIWELHP